MQTKLAMFEYLKLQAFIMHFCMIRLRKYIRTLVITRNSSNVFEMNGWINGLTVYNVHVMFEISAKTIYERNNCIKTNTYVYNILGTLVTSHYVIYQSMDYGLIIANLI
jgi:hypothetical protein